MKMDAETRKRCEAEARVIKALAHPTRVFLVEELAAGPRCVCELTALVDADISTVSKHLSILKNAGIVQDDRQGNQVFYSLRVPCILNFFQCVDAVLESVAEERRMVTRIART